jgi:ribonuclease BN (tRNA processing enzyme)
LGYNLSRAGFVVKLHFLGTTGYHPNNQRQTACLMLPELGVVLDAGTGLFRVRNLIRTETLHIFLSHAHLDHSIGLTYLLDVLLQKHVQRVTVHLAADKVDAIRNHLYHRLLFPVDPQFDFRTFSPQPFQLAGDCRLVAIPLIHPGGCHGFRIDWPGHSMAYITDTTAEIGAEYVRSIQGVTTLIHECYFPDGNEEQARLTGHSCLTPVARVARAAGAKKLYLVHINPLAEEDPPLDLETVRPIFPNTFIANDQLVIDI